MYIKIVILNKIFSKSYCNILKNLFKYIIQFIKKFLIIKNFFNNSYIIFIVLYFKNLYN